MKELFDLILHTDDVLLTIVASNVFHAYLILFAILFAETGLILFPFLPGDGLLFSAGVIAASTQLNIYWLIPLLISAAFLGNVCNYFIGRLLENKLEHSSNRWVNRFLLRYLDRTRQFYDNYGGGSIIIGRFFPIIRTYIPFLAGMVGFPFRKFLSYSLAGSVIWVLLFTLTGFMVGEIAWVKNNYGLIFLGLILLTSLPVVLKFGQAILRNRNAVSPP